MGTITDTTITDMSAVTPKSNAASVLTGVTQYDTARQQNLISDIKVDYKKLPREIRIATDLAKSNSLLTDLTKKVNELKSTIDRIVAPSLKADKELDSVT